jgi:hypothetical protein
VGNGKDWPGELDELNNRSGKCEGPGRGVNGVKNRNEKCEGLGRRRGLRGTNCCLKRKVFLRNQKHEPNIVEITHLCIMHRVHTNILVNAICNILIVVSISSKWIIRLI